jgi:hypothetical protein
MINLDKSEKIFERYNCRYSTYSFGDNEKYLVLRTKDEEVLNFYYNVYCYETDCLIWKEWKDEMEFCLIIFGY